MRILENGTGCLSICVVYFTISWLCILGNRWQPQRILCVFLADGNIYLGTSSVRIITPGLKELVDLSTYWLQEGCKKPSFCDGHDLNRDSVVDLLDFALLWNSSVEFINE